METHPTGSPRDYAGQRPAPEAARRSGPRPRYHLLVIAIDDYLHWKRLKTAVRGAKALIQVLRRQFGVRREDVMEVLNAQATRTGIIEALERMARALGPDDHWIIFFAGHGHRDDLLNSGAWIPFDCPEPESGAAAVWVKHSEIKDWVRATKARQVLIIADSCFAGDLLGETRKSQETATPEQLERWASVRSRRALTSGGIEPVYDGDPAGQSVFMRPLLEELEGLSEAAIHSGRLCDRVDGGMSGTGGRQHPWEGPLPDAGDDPGGRFVLFRSEFHGLPEEVEAGESAPQRAEWVRCLLAERDVAARLQAARQGRHREQSEASHELARRQSELDEKLSERTARTPPDWVGQPVEAAVMTCAREPHASLGTAKERVRALGMAVPVELGAWWKLLREELPLHARCIQAQERFAQITEELVTRLEAELGLARLHLNAERQALVEVVMVQVAMAESLDNYGTWPSADARSHWLSRCESALPGDDAQLLEVLEVRSTGFIDDRVWDAVSRVGTLVGLRGYLSGPPGAAAGFVPRHVDAAHAALTALDDAAAAKARAVGTVEAWTGYVTEFPEGRARSEAEGMVKETRWQLARSGLVKEVESWITGFEWPTHGAFNARWQSWLGRQGLPTGTPPESWSEEAWRAVASVVWRRVVVAGSTAAHQAYLTGPQQWIEHRAEAEAWLVEQAARERRRAEADTWEKARQAGSAAALRLHILQWPDGEHVRDAAIAWASLPVETPPVSAPEPRPSTEPRPGTIAPVPKPTIPWYQTPVFRVLNWILSGIGALSLVLMILLLFLIWIDAS